MAEITFDRYWGWMSPTSLFANAWECAYLEWVDSTQDISLVKNLSTWRKEFLTDSNDMFVHFNATWAITSREWYAWEWGQIYTDTSSDNIPEKQLSSTNTITDHTSLKWGVFLVQAWSWNTAKLHRLNENNASTGWLGWFQEDLFISDSEWGFYDIENLYIDSFWDSRIILVKGSQIYSLLVWVDPNDNEKASVELDLSFNLWRAVVGVTRTSDFIKFYTKDWKILMYNKAFNLISETDTNLLLHWVTTVNNVDYIVSEDWIYYLEGNTPREIILDWNKWTYRINNNRKIYSWRAILYIPVEINNEYKILRIWTDNKWFPQAITILPTIDDTKNPVGQLYWTWGRFNLSAWLSVSWVGKGIFSLNWTTNTAEWKILTQRFNAWSSVLTKWISELIVSWGFEDWSTIQTIINNNIISEEIPLNNTDDKNQVIRVSELNADFLDLVVQINLKWRDEFYWVKIRYEPNRK